MTKERYEEIKNRIEWLKDVIWDIQMIDHWTQEDREYYEQYNKELQQLKKKVVEEIFEENK